MLIELPLRASPNRDQRVCAAVMYRSGRVLLCQRPSDKRHGGLWEFSGGKLRTGETLATALERELAEELNLDVLQVAEKPVAIADDGSQFLIECIETGVEGAPCPSEHSATERVPPSDAETYSLAPAEVWSSFR